MKKIIIGIIVVVVLAGIGGAYLYLTKPALAPGQDAQNVVERLPEDNNSNQKVLHIVAQESKATYELNEVLRGTPNHVVGTTADIAGDIAITLNKSQTIQIGEVKINARTFKTDADMRDQNVRKLVLKSDDPGNEFIVFKTTSITGVPETIQPDVEFPVTIIGDVTIAGVTKPVTFEGTAKLSGTSTLTVKASTTVVYGDFGVSVPNFSFLANVDKSTKLSILLVAR